jgi:hypothetical protein
MTEPFPPIPTEIIREIFETTAYIEPDSTAALALVCSFARDCVLPSVLNTLSLNNTTSTNSFYNLLKSSEQKRYQRLYPTPLAHYVKNMCIYALGPMDVIAELLKRCIFLRNIAFGFSVVLLRHYNQKSIMKLSSELQEQHLVGFSNRDGIVFPFIYPSVQRLHVQISHQYLSSLRSIQDRCGNLTHLAVSLPSTAVSSWDLVVPELISIMETNPRLHIVLVQVARSSSAGSTDPTQTMLATDPRLVVFHAPMSLAKQWENAIDTPGGIWHIAEERMKKRRRRMMSGSRSSARASARDSRSSASSELALLRQTFAGLKRMTVIDTEDSGDEALSD